MEHLPPEVMHEIISVLSWLFATAGTALVLTLVWIGKMVIARLRGIETQLVQTNQVLATIEKDVRKDMTELDRRKTEEITDLERRVAVVETRCAVNHGGGQ